MGGGSAVAHRGALGRTHESGWRRWIWVGAIVLILGAMAWACAQIVTRIVAAWPQVEAAWARLVDETLLWLQFFASIGLSFLSLSWITVLLFGLFALMLRFLPPLVHVYVTRYRPSMRLARANASAARWVGEHERVAGTLLNLGASGCSLAVFSWLTRQPLDGWDFGIQCAVALGIELVVQGAFFRSIRTKVKPLKLT